MSVDTTELEAFGERLEALKKEVPEIVEELAVGEGDYAVKQAKLICKNEPGLVNTGNYRKNWHAGERARRSGNSYQIDVYNNVDYAKPLEYGYRGHWTPGHWEGKTFVYVKGAKEGQYFPFKRGHFVLRRSIKRTQTTQDDRLSRKISKAINERLDPEGTAKRRQKRKEAAAGQSRGKED